jgi:tetratricopeptide (TPR) repeat protein/DNA-binding XRE family transcriptional regulator
VTIDPDLVRQARLKAGLSLAQIAGSDLTRQAVHLIETGKVRPSMRSLQIIARRLGVSALSFQVPVDAGAEMPHRRAAELERLCERQRYDEVVELAEQLLAQDTSSYLAAFAHMYLSRASAHLGRPDDALPHARRARQLFEAEDDPWSAAEAREWEAGALFLKQDARAVAVGEDALDRYRALEPRRPEVEARMVEHLATFLVQRSDYLRAERCYRQALEVAGPVLDLARLGRIYHGLGHCYSSLGDVTRGIELLSRAVALYAVENDLRPAPARIDLPRVENDLGVQLLRNGQPERAEEFFRTALRRLEEVGAERLQSYILLSLAEARQGQGRIDEAVALIERALDLAQRLDERRAIASANRQLGELHELRHEHELADQRFHRALAILAEAGMTGARAEYLTAYQRILDARTAAAPLERSAG